MPRHWDPGYVKADGADRGLQGRRLYFLHTNPAYLTGLRLPMLVALANAGCHVTAFAPGLGQEDAERLRAHGIAGRNLSLNASGMNPFRDGADTFRLARLLRSEKPDIVFGNNIKPVVFGTIAAAMAGIRLRYALVGGLGYAFTSPPGRESAFSRRLAGLIASCLYAVSFRLASRAVFHNRDDVALLTKLRICPAAKASVVQGSGVDTDAYAPAEKPERPVFVFVGRLLRDKGVREYLQAARLVRQRHPQARCLLVGGADDNPSAIDPDELRGHVERGDVEWVGKVSDVRPYLRMSSVFVLPSYREGLPRSTLEAMACGLAVVTTDAPGCRDTVTHGDNGFLVPVGNAEALSDAMIALCEQPSLRNEMGNRSRRIALERFSCESVNADILSLLRAGASA